MIRALLSSLAALALLGACAAEQPQDSRPALELTGRVVDAADILEPAFEAQLTRKLEQMEDDTLVQLVVATTPSLQGYEIDDYARDLGNAWGIGDAARNDGLLIVVAPNERQVRIQVGFGLEETVTNEEAGNIIQAAILPNFRVGDFQTGIANGVDSLIREVTPEDVPVELKEAA